MANPSVVIDIAAEYTGKKAFDKADKSTDKLTKSVKSLAKGFVGVFAAQKLLQFGKASVKAFAEDDAAARSLGKTLENLGLAYGANIGTVNGFINRLEAQTGVLDDELRPAMDRLLRATGDVAKSQELLSLALDIAAGTGKSVTQVSQSLQKAYLGQTAALGRLGVGLSKAELATGDFETIQAKLTTLFAGQATTAADTYQGSLNKLEVAANNAKETIGKGLVDALGILSGAGTIDPTISAVDRIANAMANAAKETAKFIKVNQTLFSDLSFFKNDATIAAALRVKQGTGFTIPMTISSQDTQAADNAAKKAAEKAAALAAKALKLSGAARIKADAAAAAAKIKADKLAAAISKKDRAAAAALSKAAANFDLNKIQIAAALRATYDKDTRLRLLAMQAIENENGEAALAYLKQLDILNKEILTNKLAGIKTISETELNYLNQMLLDELEAIRISGMSEADKAAARQAAYSKYNAAIVESGGLADKNFYSASTQADLLTIARLAGLDTVAAAQKTIDLFNYDEQIKIIDAVSAAQKIADDDKMKRLLEYLALLAKPIKVGGILPFEDLPNTLGIPGAPVITGNTGGTGLVAVIPETNVPVTGTSSMFNPDPNAAVGGPGFGTQGNFDYGAINITVEGSILNGDDFIDIVNNAILNGNKIGLSNLPAGFLPG